MRKWILMLMCMLGVQTMALADNDKPIQVGQLPTKAQTLITTYFKHHKVALAKMESGLFYKSYDVIFTTGEKLEFDKSGDWTEIQCKASEVPVQVLPAEIQCKASEVPVQVLPAEIRSYVSSTYPDAKVLEIERDGKEYEVKLSNGWEITFDNQFRVIDIDD